MSNTQIYPFCYKIKTRIRNEQNTLGKCLKLYHKYLLESHNSGNTLNEFAQALKTYGDMYKTINLELYVHPKTKEIYFPDNTRLQAHYNTFLTNLHYNQDSNENKDLIYKKMEIYHLLFIDKIREIYNSYYWSHGFSELDSLLPKEYGIVQLLGKEEKHGGKRNTKKRKQMKKNNNQMTKK